MNFFYLPISTIPLIPLAYTNIFSSGKYLFHLRVSVFILFQIISM